MFQLIVTLLAFFGGILFWGLNQFTFTSNTPRIKQVIMFILACIPVVGFIAYGIIYTNNCFNYQRWGFHNTDNKVQVRDGWLNRIMFNDVDWEELDQMKEKAKEKAERERKAKLVEGLEPKTDINAEMAAPATKTKKSRK